MTIDDAPAPSRRALREQAARTGEVATTPEQDVAVTTTSAGVADVGADTLGAAGVEASDTVIVRNSQGRRALEWVDDDSVSARPAPLDLADGTNTYPVVSADLLARRPRRSPLRAGVVMPFLGAAGLVGAYAAATLLWPLYAVPPVVDEAAIGDLTAPATAVAWPAAGAAAVGVAGFDGSPASTADASSMASITKLVTALMILDEMPLAPGEAGPDFSFTSRDRQTYYAYLDQDESALNVPVGGTLSEYQMLQGMLIGSAGNYTDRLASTIWPNDSVFASAATAWLAKHNLPGITVVEPTGIDEGNTADPASLITLARYAMADPVIAEIVRTPSVTLPGAGEVVNTNDLLTDPAVVGLKTGSLYGSYNLLAAKQTTVGDATVRVYAVAVGQPSDEARDSETARLLAEATAEASTPTTLPAGTVAASVSTPWGATAQMLTDADMSLLLWNGATAQVASDLDLGDAREADAAVGSISTKGPLGSATTGLHLSADIPGPDAWWRLTHPLQLWGLID